MMDLLTLPECLEVDGKNYSIDADFRNVLKIMQMLECEDYNSREKAFLMVHILFDDFDGDNLAQAVKEASLFIDGGQESGKGSGSTARVFSWEQDLKFIISAVDRVLGYSCRKSDFLHWWDFLSAFLEIGDCMFSTLVMMRKKRNEGRMDDSDRRWWAENSEIAELKKHYSPEEQTKIDRFRSLLMS